MDTPQRLPRRETLQRLAAQSKLALTDEEVDKLHNALPNFGRMLLERLGEAVRHLHGVRASTRTHSPSR